MELNKLDLKTRKLMITLKSLNIGTYNILPTICADPTTNTTTTLKSKFQKK
ncbi:hypothetical protein [Methanobacterium lacus]|uniref:hypothetical protein n=1 Tax=Methanobacterium lacus (strain AL-21) TaxID=877455 RepID=UPI000A5EFA5B|nr:hypothetical protein [Methanobacterium lacus]